MAEVLKASVIRGQDPTSPAAWQKSGSLTPLCFPLGGAWGPLPWSFGAPASKHQDLGNQGGVMRAAQMRQPKPSLAIRKGTDLKLELEWSQTLVAEQKHYPPQRPHAPPSALWPQQHFLHGSLMGKERKWCFGVKNLYLLTLVSGSWSMG